MKKQQINHVELNLFNKLWIFICLKTKSKNKNMIRVILNELKIIIKSEIILIK